MIKLIPREAREVFENLPEVRFLNEAEQARYEGLCEQFGEKGRCSLRIPLKGSNLWKVLLLNQNGIKVATLYELGLALENQMNLSGTYEDTPAVALRSAGDSYSDNDYIAKELAKLIKRRSFPHTIIVEGLKPVEDEGSAYGLSFARGEGFRLIEAPDFDNKNNGRKFKRINPDYTINFDEKGERTLYTRDNGVSRLYLVRGLDLNSDGRNLASSGADGRVVVVSGGATQKNLDALVSKIRRETNNQAALIEERGRKAIKYLQTGRLE